MTPNEILAVKPGVLSQRQRETFFDEGYIFLEGFISSDWMDRLRVATAEIVERSRSVTASDDVFALQPGHTASSPQLRRLKRAADNHPVIWEFASRSTLPDMVTDLVGPDVKFREAMINFKWSEGGDEVKWHQDLPFHPFTNLTPLTTLLYLEDVSPDMGPLLVIPGSHKGELFDHYGVDGGWAGHISDADLARVPLDDAVALTGPAGSLAIIHCGMIHGSERNDSDRVRPVLLCGYSAADAYCYWPYALEPLSRYAWQIVRGSPARHAHHEALRLRLPPDFSDGYTSIFEDQQEPTR